MGVGLVVGGSALVGIAAWVGATTQHAGIAFGDLAQAGLNVAPPAVFVLGIGALAYGLWPRGAIGVAYGLVVWSFLVETFAAVVDSNHWLRDTSPLLHITPAPAADSRLDGGGVAHRTRAPGGGRGRRHLRTARPGRRLITDVCGLRSPRAEL